MVSQLNDFAATWTSPSTLTIGGNCSSATPCNLRLGSTVYSFTQSCTATISAGFGMAYIYFDSTGALTVGHNLTVTTSAGCQAVTGVTNFPAGSIPLATWTANWAWDTAGGLDYRAMLAGKGFAGGTGLITTDAGGNTTISVDGTVVPTYLTGTAVLNFPSIAYGACAADLSFTLAGAAVNDGVAPGWPNALEPGLVATMRVSAPSTITVRLCNLSGSAVDPASATFRATIVRSF